MKPSTLQITTDILVLFLALFHIIIEDIFSIFLFIPWIVAAALSIGVFINILWMFIKTRSPAIFLPLALHVLAISVATIILISGFYIEVIYYLHSYFQRPIVQQIEQATYQSDDILVPQQWPLDPREQARFAKPITFTRSKNVLSVMFTKTCGIWTCAGIMYISNPDVAPKCLNDQDFTTHVRQLQVQWYWIECSSD